MSSSRNSSDMPLWLGAVVVAGVGLSWLAVSQPWSSDPVAARSVTAPRVQSPRAPSRPLQSPASPGTSSEPSARAVAPTGLDNPLRMARLAYDAGMLIEPEDYSAWSLYLRVLDSDPQSSAARQGLAAVADTLAQHASVALEQGRVEDARGLTQRILGRLPEHEAALAVSARLEALAPPPRQPPAAPERAERVSVPAQVAEAPSRPAAPITTVETPAALAPLEIDPLLGLHEAFERAMAENRLLTPQGESARHFVDAMLSVDATHALAREARRRFFDELLVRATGAVETLDTDAATTWIDEAERLGVDAVAVASARAALTHRLIAMESQRPVPASNLALVSYVPPRYPVRAVDMGLEGWVDVEFTVGADGVTQDVAVTDASHPSLFRDEAAAAVTQWRFEPRTYLDQVISQRSFTRIRFALE